MTLKVQFLSHISYILSVLFSSHMCLLTQVQNISNIAGNSQCLLFYMFLSLTLFCVCGTSVSFHDYLFLMIHCFSLFSDLNTRSRFLCKLTKLQQTVEKLSYIQASEFSYLEFGIYISILTAQDLFGLVIVVQLCSGW